MKQYSLRSLPLDSVFSSVTNTSSSLTLQLNNNESISLPFTLETIYDSIYDSNGVLKLYDDILEVNYGSVSNYSFDLEKRNQRLYLVISSTFPFVLSNEQQPNSLTKYLQFLIYEESSDTEVTLVSKVYNLDIYTDNLHEISSLNKTNNNFSEKKKDLVIVDYKFNKDSEGLSTNLKNKYITRDSNGELKFKDTSDVLYKNIKDFSIQDGTLLSAVPPFKIEALIEAKLDYHSNISGGYIAATFPHLGHTSDSIYYILRPDGTFQKLYSIVDYNDGKIGSIENIENISKIYGLYNVKKLTYEEKGEFLTKEISSGFVKNSIYSSKNKTEVVELTYSSYLVRISHPAILITKGNISIDNIVYSDLSCVSLDPGHYVISTSNMSDEELLSNDISYLNYQLYKDLISGYNELSYTSKFPMTSNVVDTVYGSTGIELYYISDNTIFSKEIIYFKQEPI